MTQATAKTTMRSRPSQRYRAALQASRDAVRRSSYQGNNTRAHQSSQEEQAIIRQGNQI